MPVVVACLRLTAMAVVVVVVDPVVRQLTNLLTAAGGGGGGDAEIGRLQAPVERRMEMATMKKRLMMMMILEKRLD